MGELKRSGNGGLRKKERKGGMERSEGKGGREGGALEPTFG